jgi:hypothetical protein
MRAMFYFPIKLDIDDNMPPRWIHFVLDTGSPITLFDRKSLEQLHRDSKKELVDTNTYKLKSGGLIIPGIEGKNRLIK